MEIGKKKELRENEKIMAKKDVERDILMIKDQVAKEIQREQAYKAKFKEFDMKYEKKNDWYHKNIIEPQIEKHLQEFDKERIYNQNYNEKQIAKENLEARKKKEKEVAVFSDVRKQIEHRERFKHNQKQDLLLDKQKQEKIVQEANLAKQEEKDKVK